MGFRSFILIILCSTAVIPVHAQSKVSKSIPLPAPVLKTNERATYSETSWDLDLMKYHFTRPPDNPEPPGDKFTPVFIGKVSESAPIIGEYTLQAKEDRSINTLGTNFSIGGNKGKDTKVWIYRQTTGENPRLYNPALVREDEQYILPTVDAGEPYGMYLMWVENGKGASYPVRINAPLITWVGPDKVSPGSSLSVYGRNLSHNNGNKESYVYIRKWGSDAKEKVTPCKVTSVNPYKVTFTVPRNIPINADYEVWVHNGHGGRYGWSGPLKIRVQESTGFSWSGSVINVKSFGAAGDGSTDDSKAIQDAINSANDGDRIYFSAGTYRLVENGLTCTKKLSFEGDDAQKATILTDSAFVKQEMLFIKNFPSRLINLGIKTLKPDGKGLKYLVRTDGSDGNENAKGFVVQKCIFETAAFGGNAVATNNYGIICVSVEHVDEVDITHNVITSQAAVWSVASRQLQINNNKFYGNWKVVKGNGDLLLSFPGDTHEMDISNNSFESVDKSGPVKRNDRIIVRAIVFQNYRGGVTDREYIGENTVDRAGNPWDNSGEIILFELPTASTSVYKIKEPTSATSPVMTLSGSWRANSLTRNAVAIIKNKGVGQFRRIISNDGSVITMDRPWDVQPDSTSVISVTSSGNDIVIYNNKIDGVPNYYETESATSGIQFFGALFNNVIADNSFSNVHHGIYVTGYAGHPSIKCESTGSMGNLITGNTIRNAVYGIENITIMYAYVMPKPLPSEIPWSSNVNNVFRDNKVSDIRQFTVKSVLHGGYGIYVGQLYNDWQNPIWNGPWVQRGLIEHNTVTDAASKYMWLRQHQQWTTVRKNNFVSTGKYSNSVGTYFSPQNADACLVENKYSSIDSVYGGKLPGPQLGLSNRSLTFPVSAGSGSAKQTLSILNTGTGSLELSVSGDVPWIKTSLSSSIVRNENERSILTATVNTKGLKPGVYYGTITVFNISGKDETSVDVKLILHK
jgi:polygalacturonase